MNLCLYPYRFYAISITITATDFDETHHIYFEAKTWIP